MKFTIMQSRNIFIVMAILFVLALGGCAHKPVPLPPGSINSFDATSYDVLMTAQGAINGFKSQVASLPAAQVTKVTPVLDQAIKDYNTAEAAWQTYHAGASGDASALSGALNQLVADLAAVQSNMMTK